MRLCTHQYLGLEVKGIFMFSLLKMGFLCGSAGKESACNAGDLGSIPGLGRSPGGGNGNPPQYSCLENLHGQKSLPGYSPWGHKELDMTEQLSIAQQDTKNSCKPVKKTDQINRKEKSEEIWE